MRRVSAVLALLLTTFAVAAERTVVIGDLDGDLGALEAILGDAGLAGESGAWTGGAARLVLMGNFVPPGDRLGEATLEVVNRVRRLEREAAASGGEVRSLLGTSELALLLSGGGSGTDSELEDWLAERPLVFVADETVFVHAGLSKDAIERGIASVRDEGGEQLRSLLDARRELRARGIASETRDVVQLVGELARALDTGELEGDAALHAEKLLALSGAWPLRGSGPLFYEGTALEAASAEEGIVEEALRQLGTRRVVVSGARVRGGKITARLGGRVLRVDTGIPDGRPAYLEIEAERLLAHYPPEGLIEAPQAESAQRPGLAGAVSAESDAGMEAFLLHADIVNIEDIGIGITKPQRLTLRLGDETRRAAFKTLDQQLQKPVRVAGRGELSFSDRYVYEVAAYRLDRILELGAIPVTVLREIDGVEGAVQIWIEDSVNDLQRRESGLGGEFQDAIDRQRALMHIFDVLIFNTDRNQTNMLFTKRDWRLHLIDHSRAFRLDRGRPAYLADRMIPLSRDMEKRLRSLSLDGLERSLGDLLSRAQLRSLLKRRDALLEDWERSRPRVRPTIED